jgi:hypothetical protein
MNARVNQAEFFERPIYRSRVGHEFFRKPGRPKRMSAAEASLLFELQVQRRSAERAIEKLLDKAGYLQTARSRVLTQNWKDRGRIDVIHPSKKVGR